MFFQQFYDRPLAQASYLIGCQATSEAILVDPNRDIAPYLEVAAAEGLRITHVTETHIHADFVSGIREVHAATGAQMFLSAEGGADWQYQFAASDGATLIRDGDVIAVGNIRLDVLHTPGHTPEHLSFVVTDSPRAAGPMGVLTGDFVFVGDVGRPDLLEKAAGIANTMEAGARQLFHSLERFRTLPDHLQLWPGHGAGSACGKALGAVPSSTVGYEKLSNWGVAETNEQRFVEIVLDGQPEPPRYFAEMKRVNKLGAPILGFPLPLESRSRQRAANIVDHQSTETWIVDVRSAAQFAAAHVPGTVSVPYNRAFSTYMGTVVPYSVDIVLMVPTDPATVAISANSFAPPVVIDAIHDLLMIGLDRVVGWVYAEEALAHWQASGKSAGSLQQIAVADAGAKSAPPASFLDVRGTGEWNEGHIPTATHIPLGTLEARLSDVPAGPVVVLCQGGTRSAIAASLLERLGRPGAVNLTGGYAAWREAGLPTTK